MMKKYVLWGMLLVSVAAFPQKKELKAVQKAIKKGELVQAQTLLDAAKSVALADKKYAPRYYQLLGELNFQKAKKGQDLLHSLQTASESFEQALKLDGDLQRDIEPLVKEATEIALKKVQDTYEAKDYATSMEAFAVAYRLSPIDTVFLYNAGALAVQSKNYDKAISFFEKLKDMGYDGSEMVYSAKNKETGKEEVFAGKAQRDLMVKGGTHVLPKDKKTESKRGEIVKQIASIYIEQGKVDKAVAAIEEARKMYPKDANLVLQEANIYLQLDNKEKFKELMQEAAVLDPKNPDFQYNIGAINLQQEDYENARKYFRAALDIRPDYADAALNISTSYIREGNVISEQMNNLGNSKADNQKYDKLRVEKDALFKKAADVLEDYIKVNPVKNEVILEQLKRIYSALGDTENFKRVKQLLEQ